MNNPASFDKQLISSAPQDPVMELKELPEKLEILIKSFNLSPSTSELLQFLSRDLIGFQNRHCAEEFLITVKGAVQAAQCLEDNDSVTELVENVARGVHKLTAYKDEYEVARLFLDTETKSEMTGLQGSTGRARWHLHLRFLGRSE